MKVCLRRGYHHAFDDLLRFPPKGIEYEVPKLVSSHGQSGVLNVMKRKSWRLYSNLMKRPNMLNVRCSDDVGLIHSNSGFLIKNDMPWVVDVEHVASFVGFEVGKLERVRHVVEKYLSSKNCKKIMPWTNASNKSIHSALKTGGFDDKIEVVYPAMSPVDVKKKKHNGMNLLFVGYRFFSKGGREVLEACDALRSKYDFNLTVVSEVPDEYKKKYPHFKYVKPNLPRTTVLQKYFSVADMFVLPSFMDTFGMVYLEAMSAGIPIVASNVFALPEILDGAGKMVDVSKYSWYGRDFLFSSDSWNEMESVWKHEHKPEIVAQLSKSISNLIENPKKMSEMGKTGKREIHSGKFSIGRRNSQLKRIYEESAKS